MFTAAFCPAPAVSIAGIVSNVGLRVPDVANGYGAEIRDFLDLEWMTRLVAVLVAALLFVGCADDGGRSTPAAPSTSTQDRPSQTRTCEAPTFRVDYPGDWHVNDPAEDAPCRWVHPSPFRLPEATDATHLAIHLRYESGSPAALAEATALTASVVDRRDTKVDGRAAVRLSARATGAGLLPEGTRTLSWFLDAGPRTLVGTTSSTAREDRFEAYSEVLDAMMASVTFAGEFACSAAGMSRRPSGRTTLPRPPAPVVTTRARLIEAAVACDFDTLGEIASEGDTAFAFSYGGGSDAAAFWRAAEQRSEEPLRTLVVLLHSDPLERPTPEGTQYVWPAAYAYDSWGDVPQVAKDSLRPLYSADEFAAFADAGAYLGYRTAVDAGGEWLFFVAGD